MTTKDWMLFIGSLGASMAAGMAPHVYPSATFLPPFLGYIAGAMMVGALYVKTWRRR